MSWYRSGTIQVTNGSTAVVGTSTAFIANVAIGEGLLAPDGKVYEIAAVTSDTGLTLGSAYLGSNSSGQTYAIIPSQSYVRDLATQAATLVNSYQSVRDTAGAGKFGDGTVGSPGLQFTSDSDTGIRRTGANAIALVTGGADRVTVDANGTLAVTNSSSANAVTITQTGTGNAFVVEDSASTDSTPFQISNGGAVTVGYSTNPFISGAATNFALVGTDNLTTFAGIARHSADTDKGRFGFFKSRGAIGAHGIVSSGDQLGQVLFAGSDGTGFIQGAQITAEVDGTPGTNDMPGRLVFSTTADGASSPTERMRIDSAGNVGIGGAAAAWAKVHTLGTYPSGSGYSVANYSTGSIPSTTTTEAAGFWSELSTVAASFTLPNLNAFVAKQGTFGASSVVTSQFGFNAASSLTGATNNYGFYSNIASGTNRYNFYAAGTADNVFVGAVGIGGPPTAGYALHNYKSLAPSGGGVWGIACTGSVSSSGGALSQVNYFISSVLTDDAAFAITNLYHFRAFQSTITGGSRTAPTTQYGFFADSALVGATNNYGFYSNIASSANRYNFYAAGTADNYFAGKITSGTTIGATSYVHGAATVATPAGGTIAFAAGTSAIGVYFGSGAPTVSAAKGSLYLRSDGSTTNDRMYVNTNGSTTWTAVTTAA